MNLITSIENFNFKLEIFGVQTFVISFEKNVASYNNHGFIFFTVPNLEKEISVESYELFKSKLNELNFITWQKEYYNDVLDGEDWEIDITFNKSTRKKIVGINGYPGDNSNFIGRTEIFNELLLALNDLIQEPDFFS